MVYYQSLTFTTANQLLVDLSAFLSANGWTIDHDDVYATSYRRLHVHQGAAHFDIWSSSSTVFNVCGCTGYNSGAAPTAQPGTSGSGKTFTGVLNKNGYLVSSSGGIYIGLQDSSGNYKWGAFFIVSSKVGVWTDGFFVQGNSSVFLGSLAYSSTYGLAQLYYNGAWSPYNSAAGGVIGSMPTSGDVATKQPGYFNGGIVPFPVVIFLNNLSDSAKKHPVGYAPGLYRCSGGDIYSIGDEIIIGSDTYLIMPHNASQIGSSSNGDLLFRLGA